MDRLKTILAIVGLIAIGFAGGFVAHRQMTVKRINKLADMRHAAGFRHNIYRIIRADEQQRETLAPIVDEYSRRLAVESQESRQRRSEMIDSMYAAIKPHLSEEQVEELQRFTRRYREKGKDRENDRESRQKRKK